MTRSSSSASSPPAGSTGSTPTSGKWSRAWKSSRRSRWGTRSRRSRSRVEQPSTCIARAQGVRVGGAVAIKAVYRPADLAEPAWDYVQKPGDPGSYPFTRGVHPTMYRGRLWTMRQYSGYATAEESNQRYRFLLEQGQTGLSVAFDLPTQLGYDADHPLAEGEVGR